MQKLIKRRVTPQQNDFDEDLVPEDQEMSEIELVAPNKKLGQKWDFLLNKAKTVSKWKDFVSLQKHKGIIGRKKNRNKLQAAFRDVLTQVSVAKCGLSWEMKENEIKEDLPVNSNSKALIIYFSQMAQPLEQENKLDLDFIEGLVSSGADINAQDKYGQTVLHETARIWHVDVAKFLLLLNADVDKTDNYGRSPLHVAAAVDYPEMVKFLITHQADKQACTFGELQTPVHYAAKNDAVNSLDMLQKLDCDFETRDYKQRTPLQVAAELDRSETAKYLVETGARVGVWDSGGISAMTLMIEKMPPVALRALDCFHETDRPNRKQYFHLNLLEGSTTGNSCAKNAMEACTINKQMNLLLHASFHRLLKVKWERFAKRKHRKILATQFIFLLLWSVFAITTPHDSTMEYTNKNFQQIWWRVFIEILAILLTLLFVIQEIYEWRHSVYENNKWRSWRVNELKKDLRYCHPRWPEERKYVLQEVERILQTHISYLNDYWNLLDWCTYVWILTGTVFRVLALLGNTDAAQNHKKILATSMIIIWIRMLKFFKVYHSLGPFIVMLGHILQDTVKFCFLFLEFYIPYVIAFWMLFGGPTHAQEMGVMGESGDGWKRFNDLLYSVWLITLVGDFDYNAIASVDKLMAQILVGSFSAVSGILLLNLFIALMSDTFQRVYDNAKANQLLQKAIAVNTYQRSMGRNSHHRFRRFLQENCSPEECYYDDDVSGEGEGRLEKMTIQIKQQLDEMNEQMQEERNQHVHAQRILQEAVNELVQKQSERMTELENKIDTLTNIIRRSNNQEEGLETAVVENNVVKNENGKSDELMKPTKLPSIFELKPHLFKKRDSLKSVDSVCTGSTFSN